VLKRYQEDCVKRKGMGM
jgi:hypothetical protein